ncbi:hypothetical protein NE237_003351 [Protea cynaroides]|uniref:Uncharacterized protein n=1 Tax=Protea cynaroides TaxID=273540 RepID=A0A9Q0KGU1_9MAGN|nr:hypothetical protein NE237_003351 [Protea cynaroides]
MNRNQGTTLSNNSGSSSNQANQMPSASDSLDDTETQGVTLEEEDILLVDNKEEQSTGFLPHLTLVGKIIVGKQYRKQAVTEDLPAAWNLKHGVMLEILCSLAPKSKLGANLRGTIPVNRFVEIAQVFACNLPSSVSDVASNMNTVVGVVHNSGDRRSQQGSLVSNEPRSLSGGVNMEHRSRGVHGNYQLIKAETVSQESFSHSHPEHIRTQIDFQSEDLFVGALEFYDRTYDHDNPKNEMSMEGFKNRNFFKITTTYDPVILCLANEDKAIVFAIDFILSILMCTPRLVYSWDIVIQRVGNKLFFDKCDGSQLNLLSVNETLQEPLLEA